MMDYSEQIERDVAYFRQLSQARKENPPTKEEALKNLQRAGILDENGEFTKPYENLGRWVKENNPKR